ncbi:excinuclease ABC subunit UvrA [soil metagenome]
MTGPTAGAIAQHMRPAIHLPFPDHARTGARAATYSIHAIFTDETPSPPEPIPLPEPTIEVEIKNLTRAREGVKAKKPAPAISESGASPLIPANGRSGTPQLTAAPRSTAQAAAEAMKIAPALAAVDPLKCIRVRGAREHNLKNVDADIPRDRLVVMTGLSGSGKSSLAFDTIFAEGQRKYMESLSAYARQFLDQLKKPDVEEIQGLPPTIAIEQRSSGSNPRSTVATSTEIYDYLRLLMARCGKPTCWHPTKVKKDGTVTERCGLPISATESTQIIDSVLTLAAGSRIMVLAPVVCAQKGFHRDVITDLQKQGWGRVRVNGEVKEIREVLKDAGENPLKLGRYEKHTIEAVIDRLAVPTGTGKRTELAADARAATEEDASARTRLAESIEAALKLSSGTVVIAIEQGATKASTSGPAGAALAANAAASYYDRVYSTKHACPDHPECSLEELAPRLFSFNSPHGACALCSGLGTLMELDEALCIPNEELSFRQGAIAAYNKNQAVRAWFTKSLRRFCRVTGFSYDAPIKELTPEQRKAIIHGTSRDDAARLGVKLPGVLPELTEWMKNSQNPTVKEWLSQFMTNKPCPACLGDRLRIEALHVLITSGHRASTQDAFSAAVIGGKGGRPARDGTTLNIAELSRLNIVDAAEFALRLTLTPEQTIIAEPILKEINNRLSFLRGVGLEYLSLSRRTATLSGGEAQRIRLATQVGSGLVGACYVLDEPTIGLHQRDNDRLIRTLRHLCDIGNTVLVVEHDEDMIRAADWIIDVGPGPGVHGGRIVAAGPIATIQSSGTLTGQYLSGARRIEVPARRRALDPKKAVAIKGATHNNLKKVDAAFPLGGMICVTGVSGSGKSTLVNDILLAATQRHFGVRAQPGHHDKVTGLKFIDRVIDVDQSPIGRTPRSNPATYTGVFDDIRKVFAETKESKIRGYKPGRFSFNVSAQKGGGRCEACEGQGLKRIEMHFLPDVYVNCEVCGGSRYNRQTLEVKFRGKSIADVLNMTIEEAVGFFENHPKILRHVLCLHDVGLDYVTLGQPSTQLSGGEAQRVKLASELAAGTSLDALTSDSQRVRGEGQSDPDSPYQDDDADETTARRKAVLIAKRSSLAAHTLYILDEPTTGLHFEDIRKLIQVINRLADAGNTLVVIEHNLDVIKCADWIIDLGPEGGAGGGTIVATGTPEEVARNPRSHTGKYLRPLLGMT